MRFVFLSFAFMGWAFYELSGGADFQPRGVRDTAPVQIAEATDPQPAPPVVEPVRNVEPVLKPRAPKQAPERIARQVPPPDREEIVARLAQAGTGADLFATDTTQGLTLVSLEQGAASLRQFDDVETTADAAEPFVAPAPDIREVAGTRVNMRNGPGTNFPVISRVSLGDEVLVLSDPGNGWLRLRVLPEQQVGWISASLIRKKAD
ncbi:SH3 domain-containing protein [Cribrihabitans marinus]|uniref:SH3 domain-containing protein n=1 Tax=Cribrihabitans marinus TaxID=1227549 RepID=A0A1H7DDE4_9RHOB|nr:SH3 domain-containing protein [Cribrihabitans marinus]GGH38575.1 hypothetical protein GCM10010973_33880 [Cribrihabitans marinus]SEJ99823.1 SH3 domain-containing protein [Cribrihabitans marinus]